MYEYNIIELVSMRILCRAAERDADGFHCCGFHRAQVWNFHMYGELSALRYMLIVTMP
jgi:hypothetical protein